MKMQVLYFSKNGKGNAEAVATAVGRTFKCKCDQIPPAYPCQNEKLVIIVFDNYGKKAKQLIDFCKDLSLERASNVAIIPLSNDGSNDIGELADIFKANKVNVAGVQGVEIKKGLFGAGKLTDDKVKVATDFATTWSLLSSSTSADPPKSSSAPQELILRGAFLFCGLSFPATPLPVHKPPQPTPKGPGNTLRGLFH